MEKEYDIWCEGYVTTGQSSQAIHFGTIHGSTFKEACSRMFILDQSGYYNEDSLTYWGCKLFDNESDARNSFG